MRVVCIGVLLLAGCAPALRAPPPPGPGRREPAESLAEIQALARRIEGEPDGAARAALAAAAIAEGQRCDLGFPGHAACDYGLALALGLQARERPATASDGLRRMLERLRRAQAVDPALDGAGPSRVMALVLLRAPGWPLGPGDPEGALAEARKAQALFPDHPPNLLALAEALLQTGAAAEGRAAALRALDLASARARAGDPDAAGWVRDAERLSAARPAPPL